MIFWGGSGNIFRIPIENRYLESKDEGRRSFRKSITLTILLHDLSWFVVILTRYWILNVFTIIFNYLRKILQIFFFTLKNFLLSFSSWEIFCFHFHFSYFFTIFFFFAFEMFSCQLIFCTHGILWPNSTWWVCLWYGGIVVSSRYRLVLYLYLSETPIERIVLTLYLTWWCGISASAPCNLGFMFFNGRKFLNLEI